MHDLRCFVMILGVLLMIKRYIHGTYPDLSFVAIEAE